MKRSIFTAVAALALLLAMPAVAQEEEPYEDRTNPDARSIAPGSGLTITGTVVEWNDEQLVIQSATGVEHIQIVPDTQKPVDLQPGQNVSVDYTRTAQGVMIAQQIRPGGTTGEVTSETTVDTESELTADTELDEPDVTAGLETEADLDAGVESDLDTEVETTTADTELESDLDTDLDEDTTYDESLPATGSKLPLAGLLGLLGVAAALGLRSFLR